MWYDAKVWTSWKATQSVVIHNVWPVLSIIKKLFNKSPIGSYCSLFENHPEFFTLPPVRFIFVITDYIRSPFLQYVLSSKRLISFRILLFRSFQGISFLRGGWLRRALFSLTNVCPLETRFIADKMAGGQGAIIYADVWRLVARMVYGAGQIGRKSHLKVCTYWKHGETQLFGGKKFTSRLWSYRRVGNKELFQMFCKTVRYEVRHRLLLVS